MEEVKMTDIYTVVIETPVGTKTYEFYNIENALEIVRNERENSIDSDVYIIDYYGNILNIK